MRGSDAERRTSFFFFPLHSGTQTKRRFSTFTFKAPPLTKGYSNSFVMNRPKRPLKESRVDDPDVSNDTLMTQNPLTCSLVEDPM